MATAGDEALTSDDLRQVAKRSTAMAEAADDPSLRTALQLLAEAAENAARKLEGSTRA